MQFLDDLLVTYARTVATSEAPPSLRPLQEEALRTRACFGLSGWRFLESLPRQLAGLLEDPGSLLHAPAPLVPLVCALKQQANVPQPTPCPALAPGGLRSTKRPC